MENIIFLFYKTSNLNEEVNCTEPSPSVSIPWFSWSLVAENVLSASIPGKLTILESS